MFVLQKKISLICPKIVTRNLYITRGGPVQVLVWQVHVTVFYLVYIR